MLSIKSVKHVLLVLATTLMLSFNAQADDHEGQSDELLSGMPSGQYVVDLAHASVVWKVSHLGFSTYVGRFTDFDAKLDLNVEDFSKSNVMVDIKVDSMDTAYPKPEEEDFDKKLSEDWLKSGDAPSIVFNSSKVSALDGHSFTIDGEMSMAGQTHPITLKAKLNGSTPNHPFMKKPVVGFSATATLDRTTWGVSKYAPNIGAEVRVEIEAEFIKAE